jgi:hypothetical protein
VLDLECLAKEKRRRQNIIQFSVFYLPFMILLFYILSFRSQVLLRTYPPEVKEQLAGRGCPEPATGLRPVPLPHRNPGLSPSKNF